MGVYQRDGSSTVASRGGVAVLIKKYLVIYIPPSTLWAPTQTTRSIEVLHFMMLHVHTPPWFWGYVKARLELLVRLGPGTGCIGTLLVI